MNKKTLLLSFLCITSIVSLKANLPSNPTDNKSKGWYALSKQYATPMIIGGIIGSVTGSLESYIETEFKTSIGFLIPWIIEHCVRDSIIREIEKDLNENNIPHKKNILYNTAWIASWLAYIQTQKNIIN